MSLSLPSRYELRTAFEEESVHIARLDPDRFLFPERLPQRLRKNAQRWGTKGRQGPVTGRNTAHILRCFLLRPSQFLGKTVLDVGCGLTTLHADLASIDFSPAYSAVVDSCAEVVAQQKLMNPGADVRQSFATELPFASGAFDLVISNFCMPSWAHSAEEIKDFFQESRRVLRRGGMIAVNPLTILTQTDWQTGSRMESELDDQRQAFDDSAKWQRLDVADNFPDSRAIVVAIKQ